jgi:hypothetical protein
MTTDFPGMRIPSFSAWRTIALAIRSFVDPPIERKSTLATERRGKRRGAHGQLARSHGKAKPGSNDTLTAMLTIRDERIRS